MVIGFSANLNRDEFVGGGSLRWFTAGDEIGAWSPYCVLDDVGDKDGEGNAVFQLT